MSKQNALDENETISKSKILLKLEVSNTGEKIDYPLQPVKFIKSGRF